MRSSRFVAVGLAAGLLALSAASPAQAVTPSLKVADLSVTETEGVVTKTVAVTRSAPTSTKATVKVSSKSGTAVAPADFAVVPLTTLTFLPGQVTKLVTVKVAGDALDEANETFSLVLSSPVGATIAKAVGKVTIVDNDATPSVALVPASVNEGSGGLAPQGVFLQLSAPSGRSVSVSWSLVGGTAVLGVDLEPDNGSVVFAPGQTMRAFAVSVDGDTTDEPNERFYVQLSNAVNVTAPTYTRVTLVDDDSPMSPEMFALSPASGQSRDVLLKGVAQAGSLVAVYGQLGCAGGAITYVSAQALAAGVPLTAAANATSAWSAKALNSLQQESSCSNGVSYTHDDLAPAAPTALGFLGGNPANQNAPQLTGTAEAGSTARLYLDACVSGAVATAPAAGFATTGLDFTVADDSATDVWVDATDAAGNRSVCTKVTYVEDSIPPPFPQDLHLLAGPSGVGTQPMVLGTTEPGMVEVYALDGSGVCTGAPLVTATANQLAAGVRVPFLAKTTSYRGFLFRDMAGNATTSCNAMFGLGYTETSTETEPNDSIQTANVGATTMGITHQYGEITTLGAKDYFSVVLPPSTTLQAEIKAVPGGLPCAAGSGTLDTVLRVYDASGVQVGMNDDASPSSWCSQVALSGLAAGTYYVAVDAAVPVASFPAAYDLALSAATLSTTAETESNGTSGTANALGAFSTSSYLDATGGINPSNDVDYFSFTLVTATSVTFETVNGATSDCAANGADTYLEVYASNGTTLLGSDDDSGDGFCSKLSLSNLTAGTYYVLVKRSPFPGGPSTFDYRLTLR